MQKYSEEFGQYRQKIHGNCAKTISHRNLNREELSVRGLTSWLCSEKVNDSSFSQCAMILDVHMRCPVSN
jgi:hypothetical protein